MCGWTVRAKSERGFTLMETLISIALIVVAFSSVLPLYYSLTNYVTSNRLKAEANNIATREMERIRTAKYVNAGLVGGSPNGIFVADRDENRAPTGSFHISTRINWVDDPMDGTAALGTDPMPNDYKQADIYIYETGKTVLLAHVSSNIASESEELPITGGNILAEVFLADSVTPVENATIEIMLGPTSPLTNFTKNDGTTLFAELTPSVTAGDYSLRASMSGYVVKDNDQTTTVNLGQTRTLVFLMDIPGELHVRLLDSDGHLINTPSSVKLQGTGLETFSQSDGYYTIHDLFPGGYEVSATAASYKPTPTATPVTIIRNQVTSIDLTLLPQEHGNLRLEVFDDNNHSQRVGNSNVTLTNNDSGEETKTKTDNQGRLDVDLVIGTYTLALATTGYQPYSASVTINQNLTTNHTAYLLGYPTTGSIRVRAQYATSGAPRDNVRVHITRSGYPTVEKLTGSYQPGEALFDTLVPGTWTVQRWKGGGWTGATTVTVTAGNEGYVLYSF